MCGFKIITQYEKGIVFRFGRALPSIREDWLTWVNPFTSPLRKVNMQVVVAAVPGQEAITRDNVTLRVDAVVYYRVIDPLKAIINVQNYQRRTAPWSCPSRSNCCASSTAQPCLPARLSPRPPARRTPGPRRRPRPKYPPSRCRLACPPAPP